MWNKATRRKWECNSHSWFLQTTVQSTEEIPRGTPSFSLDPFSCPRPPSLFQQPLQLLSHLQLSPARAAFSSVPPLFLSWHQERYFALFFQLHFEHACRTAGEREAVPSPLPVSHLQGTEYRCSKIWFQVLSSSKEFHSPSWLDGLRLGSHS